MFVSSGFPGQGMALLMLPTPTYVATADRQRQVEAV
jgi:hypothetical protein